jgi:hypothetical protein
MNLGSQKLVNEILENIFGPPSGVASWPIIEQISEGKVVRNEYLGCYIIQMEMKRLNRMMRPEMKYWK